MSAIPPLSGDEQTSGEGAKMTAHDPACVKTRRRLIKIEQLFLQDRFSRRHRYLFNFEIEPENIILVALRVFEFSRGLDPYATYDPRPVLYEVGLKSVSLAKLYVPHARDLASALA